MVQEIIDIYVNNWINIWQYEEIYIGSIWFELEYFRNLLALIKKEKILIQKIELFEKDTLNFIPPDFWDENDNIKENYSKIDSFLESIKNNLDKNYFALTFRKDKALEDKINTSLRVKYKTEVTEDERLKRKNAWWEFLE